VGPAVEAIMKRSGEEIRLRYLYRNLILNGKIRLSLESARRLVGPDCAYRLYSVVDLKKKKRL
jgi:hypothetical protein